MPHKKSPAAVALGRKGGKKGGPARAAKLTPAQRTESARRAVTARWIKAKEGSDHIVLKSKKIAGKKFDRFRIDEMSEAGSPMTPVLDTSKKALHSCLKRIKDTTDERELRRLTEELQRILFHKQYQNA